MGSSVLSSLICVKGYSKLLWGKDVPVDKNTGVLLTVPAEDVEAKAEVSK